MAAFTALGARARALYRDVIKDPDLIFFCTMNEAVGESTIYDRCTKNILNGTVAGNPTLAKSMGNGFYGIDFDGTGDWVSFGDVAAMDFEKDDAFTLLALVSIADPGAAHTLFSKYDGTKGWIWRFTAARLPELVLRNTITSNEIQVTSDVALTASTLTIISATYSGSEAASGVLHYKDGVVRADTDAVNNLTATIVADGALQIGAGNSAAPMFGDACFVAAFNAVKAPAVQRHWAYSAGLL